jgi:hypothetical protein
MEYYSYELLFFKAIGAQKLFQRMRSKKETVFFYQIVTKLSRMIGLDEKNILADFHDDQYP